VWAVLTGSPFTVTDTSRVGVRLSGARLERLVPGELSSEGMVEGSVQVPPDGCPIVMLSDHPVTGGYPVIGVIDPADLHEIAQAAVGSTLRLRTARP
jgi:allophanate hydrolase subunit 2